MLIFPQPYEDEVVGSVIIRASRRLGLPLSIISQALYDDHTRRLDMLLCSRIGRLAEQSGLEPSAYLWNHTMFPYAVGYMPPDQIIQFQHRIVFTRGNARTAILGNAVYPYIKHLRYCPACLLEDKQSHGESYWHRKHQLPGVHYCWRHKIRLIQSLHPSQRIHAGQSALPHELLDYRILPAFDPGNGQYMLLQHSIAILDNRKLNNPYSSCIYRRYADISGYLKEGFYLMKSELNGDLRKYYGAGFLKSLRLDYPASTATAWPSAMLQPQSFQLQTTIKHLLLIVFFTLRHNCPLPPQE